MLGLPILTGAAAARASLDPTTGLDWFTTATATNVVRLEVTRDLVNGEWVALDGNSSASAWRSADGVAWTSSAIDSANIGTIKYINPTIGTLACGRKFNGTAYDAKIYRSTGGAWTEVYSEYVGANAGVISITTDGALAFVAVDRGTATSGILYSFDGTSWGTTGGIYDSPLARYAAYNGSRTLLIFSTLAVYSDNGGSSWSTAATSGLGTEAMQYMEGANGVFLAGDGTNIYRSTDGITWTTASAKDGYGMDYCPPLNRWVITVRVTFLGSPLMYYSDDEGVTWVAAPTSPSPSIAQLVDVAWASDLNQFLAISDVADNTAVWVSPNN